MKIQNINGQWRVICDANQDEYNRLLCLMTSRLVEGLIVSAFRRQGFSTDAGELLYPQGQNDDAASTTIAFSLDHWDSDKTFRISERDYLELLAALCEFHHLTRERDFVLEFRDSNIVPNELKTDHCVAEFQRLIPLLEASGWKNDQKNIRSPNGVPRFTTLCDMPLWMIHSQTTKVLDAWTSSAHRPTPDEFAEQQSLLEALEQVLGLTDMP